MRKIIGEVMARPRFCGGAAQIEFFDVRARASSAAAPEAATAAIL